MGKESHKKVGEFDNIFGDDKAFEMPKTKPRPKPNIKKLVSGFIWFIVIWLITLTGFSVYSVIQNNRILNTINTQSPQSIIQSDTILYTCNTNCNAPTLPDDTPVHKRVYRVRAWYGSAYASITPDTSQIHNQLKAWNEAQPHINFVLDEIHTFHTQHELSDTRHNKALEDIVVSYKDWSGISLFYLPSPLTVEHINNIVKISQLHGYVPIPSDFSTIGDEPGDNRIFMSHDSDDDDFVHEAGHFFGLKHLQGEQCLTHCDNYMCTHCPPCCEAYTFNPEQIDYIGKFATLYRNYFDLS